LNYTWFFGDGNIGFGKYANHIYADNGSYNVLLEVEDDDGSFDNDTIILTIDNLDPSITAVPTQNILEDSLFTLQIIATDVSQDMLTYMDNSSLFEINSTTGVIEFTPQNDDVGIHLVNITVIDEDGGISHVEFQINIQNTNDPPQIVSDPITDAVEETLYEYLLVVEDVDSNVFTYTFDLAPIGMSIDEKSGEILWTPTNDNVGENDVIVRVADSLGAYDIQEFTVLVQNTNDAPILEPIGDFRINEDQSFEYQVVASDIDLGDELSYYDDSDLFQINKKDGLIAFEPSNNDVGSHTITIRVVDSEEAVDSETITFTILNVNDPPALGFIGNLQGIEDELFIMTITAEDVDLDDTLTFKDNSTVFDINPKTGKISFTPINSHVGVHAVNISVVDENNAVDYENILFTIINSNDPPLIETTKLPDSSEVLVIKTGELFTLDIIVDDEDPNESLTFSDDTDLFDINSETGEISFTPKAKDAGTHTVKITVTDSEGEEDELFLTFEIEGEKEEGFNFIWIVIITVISIIFALILVWIMRKRKGKPVSEIVVFEEEKKAVVQKPSYGKFPPPPPPPPPRTN
jgi:PKD repeat protein